MIVTDKPYPQKLKACLSKKGGMGVGVTGAHRSLRPGASEASDTRAPGRCIFTTDIKKGLDIGRLLALSHIKKGQAVLGLALSHINTRILLCQTYAFK